MVCSDMVTAGYPEAYWVFEALESLQYQLNVAHEYLQDETFDALLSLDTIAADFSAPDASGFNTLATLAGILSAGFFIAGGIGGVVSVAASEVGIAASAAVGAARAARGAMRAAGNPSADVIADGMTAAAQSAITAAGATGRVAGAEAAGTVCTRARHTYKE